MSRTNIVILSVLALFLVMQVVPVDRSNPPVEQEVRAPAEVLEILERACFDCHSNETRWPWYAYVAPVSFWITHDVAEAREHMNLSTWNRYDVDERTELYEEIWEEVEDGKMPLPNYLRMHPEAELDDLSRQRIHSWAAALSKLDR